MAAKTTNTLPARAGEKRIDKMWSKMLQCSLGEKHLHLMAFRNARQWNERKQKWQTGIDL